jgi:uncharacterized protein YpmS
MFEPLQSRTMIDHKIATLRNRTAAAAASDHEPIYLDSPGNEYYDPNMHFAQRARLLLVFAVVFSTLAPRLVVDGAPVLILSSESTGELSLSESDIDSFVEAVNGLPSAAHVQPPASSAFVDCDSDPSALCYFADDVSARGHPRV